MLTEIIDREETLIKYGGEIFDNLTRKKTPTNLREVEETERTEERIEQLVEQGISEKLAEKMVGRRKPLTKIEES